MWLMGCIAYNLSFWQGIAWLVSLHLHFANVSQRGGGWGCVALLAGQAQTAKT